MGVGWRSKERGKWVWFGGEERENIGVMPGEKKEAGEMGLVRREERGGKWFGVEGNEYGVGEEREK